MRGNETLFGHGHRQQKFGAEPFVFVAQERAFDIGTPFLFSTHSHIPPLQQAWTNSHTGTCKARHCGRKKKKQWHSCERQRFYRSFRVRICVCVVCVLCVPPKKKALFVAHEKEFKNLNHIWPIMTNTKSTPFIHSRSLDNGQELHYKPPFHPVWPVHPQRHLVILLISHQQPNHRTCAHGHLLFLLSFLAAGSIFGYILSILSIRPKENTCSASVRHEQR